MISPMILFDAAKLRQPCILSTRSPEHTETQIAYVHVQIICLISKTPNPANIKDNSNIPK